MKKRYHALIIVLSLIGVWEVTSLTINCVGYVYLQARQVIARETYKDWFFENYHDRISQMETLDYIAETDIVKKLIRKQ